MPLDEESLKELEGLPEDAVILATSAFSVTPPMQMPSDAWALRVAAVDLVGDDVEIFAGTWVPEEHDAETFDGDLVIHLTVRSPSSVDVWMSFADGGQWRAVGSWPGLGPDWPHVVAPTARIVMELATHRAESSGPGNTSVTLDADR